MLLCYTAFASNKDSVFSESSLKSAIVYYGNGASLKHSSRVNLKKGVQYVVINNLAINPDVNSFQISCPDEATIMSYIHRIYVKPVIKLPNPIILKLTDSIKKIQSRISWIKNNIDINEDQLRRLTSLIENNFTNPDKQNIKSEELIRLSAYYGDKVKQIKSELYNLSLNNNECNEKIVELNTKINELNNADNDSKTSLPVGQLIIQVNVNAAIAADFDVEYFTRNAGWIASYDIRVKSIDNIFRILYKAKINQTTGLDWNNVKLNLSTGNPNLGNVAPDIFPTYLQVYSPVLYNTLSSAASIQADAPVMRMEALEKDSKSIIDETYKKKHDVSDYLTLQESQLNTNFEIDLPYTIPSDGNAYSVNIKEEKINATYEHFSVPKLVRDVFLMAKLSGWNNLNLLPGEANIIMDNIYLGKSVLNTNITDDTLVFSLGRDKRVNIDRKTIREFSTGRNDHKTESFTYEITVKNNKNQPVNLLINDQYPVSKTKEIEVTLTQNGDAEIDKDTGILTWKISLQPGESKKIKFSYQIRYPRDKMIQEIR